MTYHVADAFGPVYPALPSVAKFRKQAATHGHDEFFRDAYGAAVHAAIRTLQRQELMRAGINRAEHKCNCASGTNHNDGAAILKAVAAQNRAAACRHTDTRTDKQIRDAYEAAMAAKRAR